MGRERRKILRELESARKGLFPHRTCPASRHVHMIVEGMLDPETGLHKALHGFEPEHMAGSIASVLELLWKARRWMRWQLNDERDYLKGGEWVPDLEAIATSGTSGSAHVKAEYVLGPVHECDELSEDGGDLWQAEVQLLGGYAVAATIYAGSEGAVRRMAEQAIAAWNAHASSRPPADQAPDMVAVSAIIDAYKPLGMPQLLPPDAHEAGLKRAADAAIAALQAVPASGGVGWQPIESAPKDGTPLLLFAHCTTATAPAPVIGWWNDELGWIETCFTPNRPIGIVPTAWMPRPEFPPALKASGEE